MQNDVSSKSLRKGSRWIRIKIQILSLARSLIFFQKRVRGGWFVDTENKFNPHKILSQKSMVAKSCDAKCVNRCSSTWPIVASVFPALALTSSRFVKMFRPLLSSSPRQCRHFHFFTCIVFYIVFYNALFERQWESRVLPNRLYVEDQLQPLLAVWFIQWIWQRYVER